MVYVDTFLTNLPAKDNNVCLALGAMNGYTMCRSLCYAILVGHLELLSRLHREWIN
jgi:hypothetical protein